MAKFAVGQVVLVSFPFSDLKSQKKRPALVLAKAESGDLILCQITSKAYTSKLAIRISKKDFKINSLPITSYIRPDKIFTADSAIIIKSVAEINSQKMSSILKKVQLLFKF